MTRNAICGAVALFVVLAGVAAGADWPQWRGPERNGLVGDGPALATSWPEKGPPEVWKSEEVRSGDWGGWGSPAVAGGKVYVYVNLRVRVPFEQRTLAKNGLRRLGWFAEKPSAELVQKIEQARTSEERTKLVSKERNAWIKDWIEKNINKGANKEAGKEADKEAARKAAERQKQIARFASDRLSRGKNAYDLDVLDKLATIKGKEFPNQKALDKWYDDNNIDERTRKAVRSVIPTYRDDGQDVVYCLDAANGKTLWKTAEPGRPSNLSGTVCVADGRCYISGSSGELYCLEATSGELLWKTPVGAVHSSPLAVDGKVVAQAGRLTALHARDGKLAWKQQKVRGGNNSPACWRKDGKTYLICNGGSVSCVELETGKLLWTAPGGGSSSPAIAGDLMAITTGKKEIGLILYKLSAEKAEKLWNAPEIAGDIPSPIIHDGHVYAASGNKLFCVPVATGKVAWNLQIGTTRCASPVLADGKIIAVLGGGRLGMVKPSPEKGELLGKLKVGHIPHASPAIADGKVYLRQGKSVACFDLTAAAAAAAEAEAKTEKKPAPARK